MAVAVVSMSADELEAAFVMGITNYRLMGFATARVTLRRCVEIRDAMRSHDAAKHEIMVKDLLELPVFYQLLVVQCF